MRRSLDMCKKKICLVTNWYPTEENPYQGLFFREQAIMLSDYYDFVVLHTKHKTTDFRGQSTVKLIKKEFNISEYKAEIVSSKMERRIRRALLGDKHYTEYVYRKFVKLLEHEHIDLFYSVSAQSEAVLCSALALATGKPYVLAEHAPFPVPGTIITKDKKTAIEGAKAFLAISHDKVRQILMQDIQLPLIYYVGNMVDEDLFTLKKSLNEVKTFVVVGANSFYKNYKMLIDTFNRLTEITETPFKLLLVGFGANKGYSKDSSLLEKALYESKFSSYIDLIPAVPHENMPAIYAEADAFVMTSIQEGQPVSAIEAGCCGLPIFSTRCGGVEDYVNNDIGRIVDILDVEGLAQNLKAYLEGKYQFDSMHIRNQIIDKFGKEAFIRTMVKALNV